VTLQAFVELGSIDQAKDLVKYYKNSPLTVNGEQMEFTISNTFNFLQVRRQVVIYVLCTTFGSEPSDWSTVPPPPFLLRALGW